MIIDTALNLPTLLTIATAVIGAVIWLVRLEGRATATAKESESTRTLATQTHTQLADYKTHVAEHYVTKQGMNEQTDRLMKAVNDVGSRVESIGSRIDHFYANPPTRPGA